MDSNPSIGVIGAGSWGTAIAQLLSSRDFDVKIWAHRTEVVESINRDHKNSRFLSKFDLHHSLHASSNLKEIIESCSLLVIAVPSQHIRGVLSPHKNLLSARDTWVSTAKGIENETLLTVSQVLKDICPELGNDQIAVLSGPSFAEEVLLEMPTAVSIACSDTNRLNTLQSIFHAPHFRTYSSQDVLGVELGGALKNVIAIGVGIAEGLGFGHNTRAAMITRAIAEITRLAVKMGADPRTLSGLAGAGDLILTCTGHLSRNRSFGVEIAKGNKVADVLAKSEMVVEGFYTSRSAHQLAKQHNVEMPIVEQVYLTLHEDKSPIKALRDLIARDPKEEFY